jgi:ketosteroid isomerase-like protein
MTVRTRLAALVHFAAVAAIATLAAGCAPPADAPDAPGANAPSAGQAATRMPPGVNDGVRAAIDAANAETGRLVAAGDGAAIGLQYAEDGEVLPAHGEAVRGPAAIGRQFQSAIDAGMRRLALTADVVETHGDTAIEYGRYAAADADGRPLDHGKYVVVWRRGPEGWQRYRDIGTTSLPQWPAGLPAPGTAPPPPPAGAGMGAPAGSAGG